MKVAYITLCTYKEDVYITEEMCFLVPIKSRFRWTNVQVSEQQEFQRTFLEYLSKVR